MIEELNRLCGTTVVNYPNKDKVADLNDGLDWYFGLGFKSGLNWELDDSTNASPPIDTQNIVSGTNRYKKSAFTEKVENIIKIEVDDGTGNFISLYPETLDSFGNVVGNASGQISGVSSGSFDEVYINAASGIPSAYIKFGDFIYLNKKPNYNATAGLKVLFNRPAVKFNFIGITANTNNTLTTTQSTLHGLIENDTVLFESDGTIPTGLTADTNYYVIATGLTTTAFQVSATLGGSAVDITDAQSGSNHRVLKTSGASNANMVGINTMHHRMIVRKAGVNFMSANNTGGVYNSRLQLEVPQLLKDEKTIEAFFAGRDKDLKKRLTAKYQDNR